MELSISKRRKPMIHRERLFLQILSFLEEILSGTVHMEIIISLEQSKEISNSSLKDS
jgi:hypothetical protein